jgi:hypothetical protein
MLSILNFLVLVFISAYVLGFLTYDLDKPIESSQASIDSPQAAIDPLKQLETTKSTIPRESRQTANR